MLIGLCISKTVAILATKGDSQAARSPLPASKACFHARSSPGAFLFKLPDFSNAITVLEMLP